MRVLAIMTMLALGGLSTATAAFARGGSRADGGMGHMGSVGRWGGMSRSNAMDWHGPVGHFPPLFRHRRFFAFGFGPYFGYPSEADYGDHCWQWRHRATRSAWRSRPVNVCSHY